MPASPDANLQPAVEAVRACTDRTPKLALVLGSGLGALADDADDPVYIPASDIPGYPESTVEGHEGRLVVGTLEGTDVVFVQGRVHYYEGHSVQALTVPVQLVHALGARHFLVTNAAGGINRAFHPGTLMFITDHINFVFASPLAGQAETGREPIAQGASADGAALHCPYYDEDWVEAAEAVAQAQGIGTQRGTYIWTKGPSYETAAEIRALAQLGADAVGMSTVPEVIQAHHLGMKVLGLSTITNYAAGLSADPLDHDDVIAVGKQVRADLSRLVRGIVRETI